MEPILSICIPTYNRSQYLRQALNALVSNAAFDNEVEIVISDNCSTDDTEQIGKEYASKYPNIKYFRNEENVRDTNFCLTLDRASGQYLKLMNDNRLINENGLQYMKAKIKEHLNDRTALFFTEGVIFNHPLTDSCVCNSFDDFLVHLSYYVTAISSFGAWKEDWNNVTDKVKFTKLLLNQDDWAYQVVAKRGGCVLYTGKIDTAITIDKKYRSGYNWFQVHVANYYDILQPYIDKGLVSRSALSKEKKTYLKNLKGMILSAYLPWLRPNFQFDTTGTAKILWKYFKSEPYFHLFVVSSPIWISIDSIKFVGRRLSK